MQEEIKRLSESLEKYVKIIISDYADKIPQERLEYLNSITDYTNHIKIEDTGTISCFVNNNDIYFPLLAHKILPTFYSNPMYGTDKGHKAYKEGQLILNNNTFIDYINHVIIAGLNPEEFYEETLLHETMHFCGTGGADPLREGFTELKTRELAQRYGLLTSGCGYPKEVQIVYRLQQIFGKETCDSIAFARNNTEIATILAFNHGEEAADFYLTIRNEMKNSFGLYYQNTTSYSGIEAPFKKAEAYNKIDYSNVNKIIDTYEQTHKLDENASVGK